MIRSLNVLLIDFRKDEGSWSGRNQNKCDLVLEYLFLLMSELLDRGHNVLAELRAPQPSADKKEDFAPDAYKEIKPESLFDFCPDILITTKPRSAEGRTLELSKFAQERAGIPVIWLVYYKDRISESIAKDFSPDSIILIKEDKEGIIKKIMEKIEILTTESTTALRTYFKKSRAV